MQGTYEPGADAQFESAKEVLGRSIYSTRQSRETDN